LFAPWKAATLPPLQRLGARARLNPRRRRGEGATVARTDRYGSIMPVMTGAAGSKDMTLGTILIIILILLLIGALPSWGHSRSWGYGPSGLLGIILIVIIILLLMGRL
jgi:hypothetical protein